MNSLSAKMGELRSSVAKLDDALVAFSGGVDSSLVLKICHDELKERAIAVTAVSPSFANNELENAKKIAEWIGVKHIIVKGTEAEDTNYLKNDMKRCYFCKSNLYSKLLEVRKEFNFHNIVNGINHDDLKDYRPGIKAAGEYNVISPLRDCGLGKLEIVEMAKYLSLPNWNKPASPCLSSRVPYGIAINDEILKKIELAEDFLRSLGLLQFRVRYHNDIARIEAEKKDFQKVLENSDAIITKFREIGFRHITLDLRGFRSGSLNQRLENVEEENRTLVSRPSS